MAYKFNCVECGHELFVKWLKPGETAKCHKCGSKVKVPANAAQIENDLVPLTELARKEDSGIVNPDNCPACRYVEKINAAELEEVFPVGIFGACHRYPPGAEGRYPLVTSADWCGEFDKKE
ncbi:MAG: hypothetical protein Q7R35_05245 [Elusimicrobiota bacterium]|nr:hypothetical protein [Elusimicrobiota bacterium]